MPQLSQQREPEAYLLQQLPSGKNSLRRSGGPADALIEDDDPVRPAVGQIHIMRGHHHSCTLTVYAVQAIHKLRLRQRVQIGCWLIEQ
ncbi:hypothetical protein D3C74_413370 [compost metagenome]